MILQVIGSMRGGGAEKVALTLHEGFLKLNQKSKILVLHKKVDYPINNKYILFEEDILSFIQKTQPNLIIAHMQSSAEQLQAIKGYPHLFFVIHTTISQRFKYKNFFSRIKHKRKFLTLYKNSQIISVSDGIKEDLKEFGLFNVKRIYNPFNFEKIQKLSEEELNLKYDYIISVGNLTRVKRQDLLIKVISLLKTDLHLILLGKGHQEKNLKSLVKELHLEERVHFLGWKENPYKYMKNAKLFVLSSDVEGFGNVIVESLALNIPVVSMNCPSGPNEILVDELSSFLVNTGDILELKEKIELALTHYPNIKKEYYKKFDYIEIAKEYIALKS
jgi:glycosyltransferase involved in cell wall biosynthesis